MLESVIQKEDIYLGSAQQLTPRFVSPSPDSYPLAIDSRHHSRLISGVTGLTFFSYGFRMIDLQTQDLDPLPPPLIAPTQDRDLVSPLTQLLGQPQSRRRLACASHGQIAHTDHRAREAACSHPPEKIEKIENPNGQPVK